MNFYSRIQRIDAMLDHNSEKWLSYSGIPVSIPLNLTIHF
jgi:hypothetical protein